MQISFHWKSCVGHSTAWNIFRSHNVHQTVWRKVCKGEGLQYNTWIGRRREFGMYDQLMVELRNEDTAASKKKFRMPTDMFDEIVARVGPRITKQHTRYREPLEPGLKIAKTLRHLAYGNKYSSFQFSRRHDISFILCNNDLGSRNIKIVKFIFLTSNVSAKERSHTLCISSAYVI